MQEIHSELMTDDIRRQIRTLDKTQVVTVHTIVQIKCEPRNQTLIITLSEQIEKIVYNHNLNLLDSIFGYNVRPVEIFRLNVAEDIEPLEKP